MGISHRDLELVYSYHVSKPRQARFVDLLDSVSESSELMLLDNVTLFN